MSEPTTTELKAVSIIVIARDESEAQAIVRDFEQSQVLNEWPVFAFDKRDATVDEREWLTNEYDEALRDEEESE